MIDQKTRQLDADFKNLEYADKDDPALMDNSPKDMHPSSPSSSYVPSSANAQRSDEGSAAGSSGTSSSNNNERNSGNHSNSGGNANTSGAHTDRNSKRSRRARETASRSGNNTNTFSNMSKTSQIDLASDSNNSNSNQSNKNAGSSGQPLNTGGSSNSSRKQGGNNAGGNNSNKKRKRKSARSQNGGNGKSSICFSQYQKVHKVNTYPLFTGGNNSNNMGSASQSNARLHDETPPLEETIDPDEPTYCLCDQISFGEMILCDNDLCPIEWFHFSCVSLTTKPKGKWFCPNCRGDRPSVMKPKQQFLKELERYNREKEEKT